MKNVYPIIVNKDYSVYIPDFDQHTEGRGLADALAMARDCIESVGCFLLDEKKELPTPFSKEYEVKEDSVFSLVDVDFESYRKRHSNSYIRRNVTIPEYLDEYGRIEGLNFSKILADALALRLKDAIDKDCARG